MPYDGACLAASRRADAAALLQCSARCGGRGSHGQEGAFELQTIIHCKIRIDPATLIVDGKIIQINNQTKIALMYIKNHAFFSSMTLRRK